MSNIIYTNKNHAKFISVWTRPQLFYKYTPTCSVQLNFCKAVTGKTPVRVEGQTCVCNNKLSEAQVQK
jgi:hypothetical protein